MVLLLLRAVMPLLFLSMRYGRAVHQMPQSSGGSRRYTRKNLLEKEWVKQRAQECNLLHVLEEQKEFQREFKLSQEGRLASGSCFVRGLAVVSQGQLAQGILTNWNQEEVYLKEFLAEGLQGTHSVFSLRVERAVKFAQPLVSFCPLRFSSDLWEPDKLEYEDFLQRSGLTREELESKLQINADEIREFLKQPLGLRVPPLVAELIFLHRWKAVVLKGEDFRKRSPMLARRKVLQRDLGNFPPEAWVEQAQRMTKNLPAETAANHDDLFQAEHAAELAKCLREWSGAILNSVGPGEEKAETQFCLEGNLMRLDRLCQAAENSQRGKYFSKMALLNALCAAMGLRDRSKLAETFRLTLGCVPGAFGAQPLPRLPDSGTISRSQITIDTAFCCWWQRQFERCSSDCHVFVWADSSPQGGTDWLLSMIRLIEGRHLRECVGAANYLARSAQFLKETFSKAGLNEAEAEATKALTQAQKAAQAARGQQLEDIVQERHAAGLLLQEKVVIHRQIPMALGSGLEGATLEQKLLCMCKKFLAETHRQQLAKEIMGSVRAICTDLGTESGFAEHQEATKFAELLPRWMADPGLELDGDELLLQHVDNVDEAAQDSVFHNALPSPGLMHIIFNMCNDLHKKLSKYEEWLPGFKAIATLLHHGHLRKRYLKTCISNGPWSWMAFHLDTGVKKPAMWRWGTIQAAVPQILQRKRLLQLTWNPQKFNGGVTAEESGEGAADSRPREDEDMADFRVDAVTAAVQSEAWWLYTCMLAKLNQFPADLGAWAEGCSCHPWLVSQKGFRAETEDDQTCDVLEALRKQMGYPSGSGDGRHFGPCPLAGQRAPELASGVVWQFLDAWGDVFIQQILEGNQCMDPVEIEGALQDFAAGKAMMVEYLRQKLQCWDSLPWKLAALNVDDKVAARQIAKEAMESFDSKHASLGAAAAADVHHRHTLKFFLPRSGGRAEMEAFVNGADLEDLPLLSSFVWSLRFVPTVERVQEGDHSITKQHVIHRGKITAPYVSCRLRIPEIRKVMQDPAQLEIFLEAFQDIANPDDMAKRFGFWNHPLWITATGKRYSKRLKLILASAILYAAHPEVQFQQVTAAREKRGVRKKEKEKRVKAALRASGVVMPQGWSYENVERKAMASHLQEKLSMGALYSFSHDALNVFALRAALQPQYRPALQDKSAASNQERLALLNQDGCFDGHGAEEEMLLEPDVEPSLQVSGHDRPDMLLSDSFREELSASASSLVPAELVLENVVFLRMVNSSPSRRKNVNIPAAERNRLSPSDLCVTFHKCRSLRLPVDEGHNVSGLEETELRLCVNVSPEAASGISHQVNVLSLCGNLLPHGNWDVSRLKTSLRRWQPDKTLVFGLVNDSITGAASQLLGQFVLQRAFPDCGIQHCVQLETYSGLAAAAAEELKGLRVVEECETGSGRWRLTRKAMKNLVHMHAVREPEPVFRTGEELCALPMEEMHHRSGWELLQMLTHQGWVMARGPQKVSERQALPPITHASTSKAFFVSTLNLSSKQNLAYMKALYLSEVLFAEGFVQAIHHGQKEKYYLSVLERSCDGRVAEEPLQVKDQSHNEDWADSMPALELDVERHMFAPSHNLPLPADREYGDPLKKILPPLQKKKKQKTQENEFHFSDLESEDGWSSSEGFVESGAGSPHGSVASFVYSPSVANTEDLMLRDHHSGAAAAAASSLDDVMEDEIETVAAEEMPSAEVAAVPPPPLEEAPARTPERKPRAKTIAEKHPDSFDWGPFRFTFTGPEKRPPHGQWQATCPFHRLNAKTGCTRATQVGPTDSSKDDAKRTLQTWCLLAPLHDRKRRHTSAHVKKADVLPQELLDQRLMELQAPAARPQTDEELDLATGAAAEAPARAKQKVKAKGKPKPGAAEKEKAPKKTAKAKASRKRKRDSSLSSDSEGVEVSATKSGSSSSSSSSSSSTSSFSLGLSSESDWTKTEPRSLFSMHDAIYIFIFNTKHYGFKFRWPTSINHIDRNCVSFFRIIFFANGSVGQWPQRTCSHAKRKRLDFVLVENLQYSDGKEKRYFVQVFWIFLWSMRWTRWFWSFIFKLWTMF